jgi:hypothetical protein
MMNIRPSESPPGNAQDHTGTTAVLVVHGIGAQQRGESARKLIAGLARVEPALDLREPGGTITVGGQTVRVYEVYWADLLKGDMTRGAFQMAEMQSLSWFPWLNVWCRNYRRGSYSPLKLAWWCVMLPVFNFFAMFAYYGAGLIAQIVRGPQPRPEKTNAGLWQQAKDAAESARPTAIDTILDEYVGDVFSYVNSAGNAFYREKGEPPIHPDVRHVYPRIVQQFYEQLLAAQADGCAEIQIVAHSLGTVVAYHALSGLRFEAGSRTDTDAIRSAVHKVRRLYTIGSPLEKIRFFWPTLIPGDAGLGDIALQWENFVSWFDPVAGAITRFGGWGEVFNHRLLGGGFLRGHVVYEHSPVFLGVLTRGLCGRALPLHRTRGERWRDRLVLLAETLFAPVAAAIVLAFVLTALLLPFLVSLVLRQFLPEPTWVPIENVSALVFIGLMGFVFLLVPVLRATTVHRLHWVAARQSTADTRV